MTGADTSPLASEGVVDSDFAGTMAVAAQHRFDVARLEAYLRAHLPGFSGALAVEQFRGGQSNPTYLLNVDGVRRYVLRKKPPGVLLPSAHAVDREYRIMAALRATDVPVAQVHCLCTDESVLGTMFFVMDYMAGRSFWNPALPDLAPGERRAIYDEMNRVIAALHAVDYVAVGLEDYGKPGNYFARQIARWSRQYRGSETERIDAMERLIAWLPENIPPGEETTLVHGDFRIDNLIFHSVEPRVIAVVDWELSTLGSPLADFSYHVMAWRLEASLRGLGGHDLPALGIPDERTYVDAYCRRTGRAGIDPRHWEFYMAYNLFRVACIRQGILHRALAGNASNPKALEAGRRARQTAEEAWRQVERLLGDGTAA